MRLWRRLAVGVLLAMTVAAGPSMLLVTEDFTRVDFGYMRALHERGFQVDYLPATRWHKQVRDGTFAATMARYNVVVVLAVGASGPFGDFEQMFAQMADYARGGGGLFFMPTCMTADILDDYKDFHRLSREVFGATWLSGHWVVDDTPDNVGRAGLRVPVHLWTDNVTAHPLTAGIRGIWYGQDTYRNWRCGVHALALADTDAWQVLLRGMASTRTVPYPEYVASIGATAGPGTPIDQPGCDSAPPLLAVRQFGKGRVVYFPLDDIKVWCAGYHFFNGAPADENGPGAALGGTIKGRTSDLEKLVDNCVNWLAEPSVAAGSPGGYTQDPKALATPQPDPRPAIDWRHLKFAGELPAEEVLQGQNLVELKRLAALHGMENVWEFWADVMQFGYRPYSGIIGARTTASDGRQSVADMVAAARAAGLDFIVFLERFDLLDEAAWKQLDADCQAATTDDFVALPGFTVDSNRNHSLFIFGPRLRWPAAHWLTADGKQVDFRATKEGSGLNRWIQFMIEETQGRGNQMGYYHFTAAAEPPAVRAPMYDLRLYSAVGLYYYDGGRLVEGPEQNFAAFSDVNDLHLGIEPMSIDIVRDGAELAAAAREHALTHVLAKGPADIADGLRYTYRGRESGVSVGPLAGPRVQRWGCLNRDYTSMPVRRWVTPNYRWRCDLAVASDVGLETLEIWDGVELFRRLRLNGVKRFEQVFELSHAQQRQLLVVATDVDGRQAISGPLANGNHISSHYFCSDRINGGLYHGPGGTPRLGFGEQRGREYYLQGFDTNNPWIGNRPRIVPWYPKWTLPDLFGPEPGIHGFGGSHCRMDCWSEDAHVWSTFSDYSYPETEHIIHAWYTYGPLVPRQRSGTVGWRRTVGGDLQLEEIHVTARENGTIGSLPTLALDYRDMHSIPGNRVVFACAAGPGEPVHVFNIPRQIPQLYALADSDFRFRRGGFAACFGTLVNSGSCNTYFVDDYERRLVKGDGGLMFIAAETLPAGLAMAAGEVAVARSLQLVGTAPPVTGGWYYAAAGDWLGLDGKADTKLRLAQGKSLPVTDGFRDVDIAQTGYADMTLEPDEYAPIRELPVRLHGGSSRWAALQYRPDLKYISSVRTYHHRYVTEIERAVPDAVKPVMVHQDVAYVVVPVPEAAEDPVQVLAGYPVTASDPRVFVNVTALSWQPYTYVVTVNNPTDETLTVTLKPGLPLPNLPFETQRLELAPGAWQEAFRNGE